MRHTFYRCQPCFYVNSLVIMLSFMFVFIIFVYFCYIIYVCVGLHVSQPLLKLCHPACDNAWTQAVCGAQRGEGLGIMTLGQPTDR